MPSPQARWFIATIPHECFTPFLPPGISYIRGQLERGETTGYLHWQLVLHCTRPSTVTALRNILGPHHYERTRSSAALQYVWKSDTAVDGTRFQLGQQPFKRNDPLDWNRVWESAVRGDLSAIPADIRVRNYNSLRRIHADHATANAIERQVFVFWGKTGTGKSLRAWEEAGLDAYPKDPRTKWWDGYTGQNHVVMDEFRGCVDIAHLLRWFDRYPVLVEVKGASTPLKATKIWITSNISPDNWYVDLDSETKAALRRRLQVTHFSNPFDV